MVQGLSVINPLLFTLYFEVILVSTLSPAKIGQQFVSVLEVHAAEWPFIKCYVYAIEIVLYG